MVNTQTTKELTRRRKLANNARALVTLSLPVEDADESSLMLGYEGFFLQVEFSELQPLMVFYINRILDHHIVTKDISRHINDMNLKGVLGCHAVNTEEEYYSCRFVHWLDAELTKERFFEMLSCSIEESKRIYAWLLHRTEATA